MVDLFTDPKAIFAVGDVGIVIIPDDDAEAERQGFSLEAIAETDGTTLGVGDRVMYVREKTLKRLKILGPRIRDEIAVMKARKADEGKENLPWYAKKRG